MPVNLVTLDNKPWFAVEVKSSAKSISRPLRCFASKLSVPFVYQVVRTPGTDFMQDGVRVISAGKFLSGLV